MANISENLEVLNGLKVDIKTAIENKGVVINDTIPFVDYATKINEISIGTGDYETGFEDGAAAQKAKLTNITINYNGNYSREDGYGEVIVDIIPEPIITIPLDVTLTENGTYNYDPTEYGDGYSSVKVIVDVPNTGLLPLANGTKLSHSTFTEIPSYYDFSNITNMERMFYACLNIQTIPLINTSAVTQMVSMFQSCKKIETIPLIDTSNVTDMANMFADCINLQTIPALNTSNVVDMSYMFDGCYSLTMLPALNVTNVVVITYYFDVNMEYLTDVGGWINLNCNWVDDRGLAKCPNLTYQSCINILNGLADVAGIGGRTLKVHQNFLTTVGDEISIGTDKGWSITA